MYFEIYHTQTRTMSSKKYCRDTLRKQVLDFTKGKDLKKQWMIEKLVEYNGVKYPNECGHDTGKTSGMWKMGFQLFPSEEIDGYKFIHYTIWEGKVVYNAELNLNKKLTCMSGFMNFFGLGTKCLSANELCKDYLEPLLREKSPLITSDNGFEFKYL